MRLTEQDEDSDAGRRIETDRRPAVALAERAGCERRHGAVAPGHSRAHGDQRGDVEAAVDRRPPAARDEGPARPEHDRRSQYRLQPVRAALAEDLIPTEKWPPISSANASPIRNRRVMSIRSSSGPESRPASTGAMPQIGRISGPIGLAGTVPAGTGSICAAAAGSRWRPGSVMNLPRHRAARKGVHCRPLGTCRPAHQSGWNAADPGPRALRGNEAWKIAHSARALVWQGARPKAGQGGPTGRCARPHRPAMAERPKGPCKRTHMIPHRPNRRADRRRAGHAPSRPQARSGTAPMRAACAEDRRRARDCPSSTPAPPGRVRPKARAGFVMRRPPGRRAERPGARNPGAFHNRLTPGPTACRRCAGAS